MLIGKRSDDGTSRASFTNTESLDPRKVFKQYRFCVDYRNLNLKTKWESHSIPRIDDTLDALCQKEGQGSIICSLGVIRWNLMSNPRKRLLL